MKNLKDNDIEWIHFDKLSELKNEEYIQYINELNTWRNEGISKFISNSPIGEDMDFWFKSTRDTELYFALNKDKNLIACTLISPNAHIDKNNLLNYILDKYTTEDNKSNNQSISNIKYLEDIIDEEIDNHARSDIPNEEYLDKDDAEIIYYDNIGNSLYVEYIIVNPNYQGRGVATKFYKTIKQNPEFFGGDEYTNLIHLSVNHSNIHSRKSVLKNGFRRTKPNNNHDFIHSVYYCRIKNKDELKEENINERI